MKKIIAYCCMLLVSATAFAQEKLQEINPIIHDQSFTTAFGVAPDKTTDEQLRIQTHLSYAEYILRIVAPAGLTKDQQAKRALVLDLLNQYWQAGKFPANKDYPGERRPCFIDDEGNICAVGYLVEQTKGHEMAEAINAKHQYDLLLDMKEPALEAWANEYGLTLEECATIQPTYWQPLLPQTREVEIKTGYGVSSGVIGGANIAFNIALLSNRWRQTPVLSYIGLVTGTGQLILGAANVKANKTNHAIDPPPTLSYKRQNNLSYANIALGTTTIVTSALNLILNKSKKENKNAFNLYSYPNYASSVTMGLSFTRRM
jgi:hypothetical protein